MKVRFEITNMCQLRCPSCTEGRRGFAHPKKFEYIDVATYETIITKLADYDDKLEIFLFESNEPCLHPNLDEILDVMDRYGIPCIISSNLNVRQSWKHILSHSCLRRFIISTSGYNKDIYERGHRGGNVDLLLENISEIASINKEERCPIWIRFHQYNDNIEDARIYEKLCDTYGFTFNPVVGYLSVSPSELTALVNNDASASLLKEVSHVATRVLHEDLSLLKPVEGLESAPCSVDLSRGFSIDCKGNMHMACCIMPPPELTIFGNILNFDLSTLQNVKFLPSICGDCKKAGYHYTYPIFYTFIAEAFSHSDTLKPMPVISKIFDFFASRERPELLGEGPVYLYGFDGHDMIRAVLSYRSVEIEGVFDDNPRFHGKDISGLEVSSPWEEGGSRLKDSCVVICFNRPIETMRKLKERLYMAGAQKAFTLHDVFGL